jgi:hypothetical protein
VQPTGTGDSTTASHSGGKLAGEYGTRAYGPLFNAGKTRARSGDHGELTKGWFADGDKAKTGRGSVTTPCETSATSREETIMRRRGKTARRDPLPCGETRHRLQVGVDGEGTNERMDVWQQQLGLAAAWQARRECGCFH